MSADPIVTVATVTQDGLLGAGAPDFQRRFDATFQRMEEAAACRPDILCLPECSAGRHCEPVPEGPAAGRLAEWAKDHNCYVVAGLRSECEGRKFNSALLFDRRGKYLGKYDKMHLTRPELDAGICPGRLDPPVFQTDFGVIGVQICFDVNWSAGWEALRRKGAGIVFYPAAFPAHVRLAAYTWLYGYYIVSSTNSRRSRLYDIAGEVLAETGEFRQWAAARLPLGKRLFEIDFHVEKARQIERKYGPRVEVRWCHDDDWWTLASLDPELCVEGIIREFELVPKDRYVAASEADIQAARRRFGVA
jgi:predicted amidohydrolase